MKTETIIVTGAAGFIGSCLVARLNELGYEKIIIVDRLESDEKWKNIAQLRYDDFIHADDFLEYYQSMKEGGIVVHLGANSSTMETDADYLLRNNYEYTKKLGDLCVEKKGRFIYASSAATYGDGTQGMSDEIDDLNILKPLNMYGYSKHMYDQYAKRTGLDDSTVGLKFFNVFGPNEEHKGFMRSVVAKAYEQLEETGKVTLFKSYREEYADGEQMRDFVYVKDVVEVILYFMENRNENGLFNVGSGEAATWNRLVKAIFAALEKKVDIEYIDMPEALKEKYQYYTCATGEKLKRSGYTKGFRALEDSVLDYVSEHLKRDKKWFK